MTHPNGVPLDWEILSANLSSPFLANPPKGFVLPFWRPLDSLKTPSFPRSFGQRSGDFPSRAGRTQHSALRGLSSTARFAAAMCGTLADAFFGASLTPPPWSCGWVVVQAWFGTGLGLILGFWIGWFSLVYVGLGVLLLKSGLIQG